MSRNRSKFYLFSELCFGAAALLFALSCGWSLLAGKKNPVARGPAAADPIVPPPAIPRPASLNTAENVSVLQLGCVSAGHFPAQEYKTTANMVRLETSFCDKKKSAEVLSGTNLKNSYGISLMPVPHGNQLVSNYFQLEPGTNDIKLELKSGKQTIEAHLRIIRN